MRWLLVVCGVVGIAFVIFIFQPAPKRSQPISPKSINVPLAIEQPEPAPLAFQPDIAPEDAAAINAARADYVGAIATARAFQASRAPERQADLARATDCLTKAIYYEAASESQQGQRAVAQVVLNRVRDPRFPASVCGVVFQGSERSTGCQFSFTCDGALARKPIPAIYERAHMIAVAALSGRVEPSVGLATHYHTYYVVPVWRTDLVKLRTVGAHIFYAWQGRQTSSRGLRTGYAGIEPEIFPTAAQDGLSADILPEITGANDDTNPFAPPIPKTTLTAPKLPTQDFGNLRADDRAGKLVTNQSSSIDADSNPGTLQN